VNVQTHHGIDRRLCGEPTAIEADRAVVALTATAEMAADDRGLVHGGFVFGAADYAAMLAVNHPNVVLGSADVRFLAPVVVGEVVVATAAVVERAGRKHRVEVSAAVGDRVVFSGVLTTFVLDAHVLEGRKA
jgi:acyl-coenzyme A thioesterase PaaI-like protein